MRWIITIAILLIAVYFFISGTFTVNGTGSSGMMSSGMVIDTEKVAEKLKEHLRILTVDIGERSVLFPENIKRTGEYIESFYTKLGMKIEKQTYRYRDLTVDNIITEISLSNKPVKHFIVGAHYDSVAGTVGADDNASAVAVQLETARLLNELKKNINSDVSVKFVSFPLEEPPVFRTGYMGSAVYAGSAKKRKDKIDGMICLEMVGYACDKSGCQNYPFPLKLLGYPKTGNFIGIVGDSNSSSFTKSLFRSFRKNRNLPVIKLTVPFRGLILPSVRLSDHASFWDRGYRAVMVTDTAFYRNHNYHLASDTMDKLDYQFMAELVKSLVAFFDGE